MDKYNIGDLLMKVPLEEVVRRLGIETERRGVQTRALCPFHQDSRPSLNLFPADGNSQAHYHCFACGAHGNAIDLVKQVERLEFLPAVQWLAQQFGIQSPRHQHSQQAERKATNDAALDFALQTFDDHHDIQQFEAWCEERAFDASFLYDQGLRCITRAVLVENLQAKSIGERAELIDGLQAHGLIKRLRSTSKADQLKLDLPDQFQDFFHDGRVVIPIRNASAKRSTVVGFAGRSLLNVPPEGVPKYLLTPGFEKAKYLFNASAAFAAVAEDVKNGKPATLYLVEGFMDALRMQALGQRAVALMGTSLGKVQYELLQKFVDKVLPPSLTTLAFSIFLDNDPAGFGGTDRLVREFLSMPGVDLRWVGMPWRTQPALGKDPDTCLRSIASPEEAVAWLQRYDLPAEAVLLVAALGSQDASELQELRWDQLATVARERALFRAALGVKKLHGSRSSDDVLKRVANSPWNWANALHEVLSRKGSGKPPPGRSVYLEGEYERAAHARTLAYHGARRGELPCDEEVWLTLSGNARLFDQTALERLRAMMSGHDSRWRQAAPFDAVHLPRKLTAEAKVLDNPRRKVMPHPADLHLQQLLLNEFLTQRHDHLNADGQTFSASIPAVRWYASRREVVVTGPFAALNHPDLELDEPATLSFGYQIDMDVLEGDKTPSDQGMFRPFGQCWREFMASLTQQCHAIGPRVHVLRLDAKRYYDAIQRYVVRDALLEPLRNVLTTSGLPEGFANVLGLNIVTDPARLEADLERLLSDLLFGHEFRDPQRDGSNRRSDEAIGIPQGPVLSAYIGTIALLPVDDAARQFMRRTAQTEADGMRRPRAGYARYVDDIVLFADSDALLKELRETLQAKATERSIALIHKGDRVRAGSPTQVMRQLNEGRGLAASVPAWEPPLVGDGEAGWGLGGDMPTVDRQCALKMLRHPALMANPSSIAAQVKQAMLAPDLRTNDLGLCARWLWWLVAAESDGDQVAGDGSRVWGRYLELWDSVCEGHSWAEAFKQRGYHWLYAVEGLDKLMDGNPWLENDQTLAELPKNREKRRSLAREVCERNFFEVVRPEENYAHVRRRTRLVQRKARSLAGTSASDLYVEGQHGSSVSAIEWLCLAAERLGAVASDGETSDPNPLVSLRERRIEAPAADSGDGCVRAVCQQLQPSDVPSSAEQPIDNALGLCIDFVLSSAPRGRGLDVLSKFPNLLVGQDSGVRTHLIPHLPVAKGATTSLYAVDAPKRGNGRHLYRYSAPPSPVKKGFFVHVALKGGATNEPDIAPLNFKTIKSQSNQLAVEKSKDALDWAVWSEHDSRSLEPITHRAARLFEALRAMHGAVPPGVSNRAYVPFKPQLFKAGDSDQTTLQLVADPVDRELLGVSAWFHDHDDRVHAVNVPQAHADLWRVGWAVADLLGVAADMAGETGHRDERLPDEPILLNGQDGEALPDQSTLVEHYVLRQQLRKLQGAYVSEAQFDNTKGDKTALPGTVRRALSLLSSYPDGKPLHQQVRHLLIVEAETRAMALRLQMRSGDDLRKVLHRVFPDALDRLPLWALQGLELVCPPADATRLRPELALMLALYRALDQTLSTPSPHSLAESTAPQLRIALTLAAVGIGLRGSVAALWGLTVHQGSRRMAERFNLPVAWAMPNMARLDPQGDYSAMRKWLYEADWPALCRASPWHWMLALIGLLDTSFPQAFDLPELKLVYSALSAWQSESAGPDETNQSYGTWPFDSLPEFTPQRCDVLILALPEAICRLDELLGQRVVRRMAQQFRRSLHSDEFTDASDASWQIAKPQFTGLGYEGVERRLEGRRWLLVWTETRRIVDNELLAVHTLDFKLGQWLPAQNVAVEDEQGQAVSFDHERVTEVVATATVSPSGEQPAQDAAAERPMQEAVTVPASPPQAVEASLGSSQRISRESRRNSRTDSHFRVALFQWRADDSYTHPLCEIGLSRLPLHKSSQEELGNLLLNGVLKAANKAAKRGAESQWNQSRDVISWSEHRRQVLLTEALKACNDLGVQLLVLPEVSVRPDTVRWLKSELRRYPGLAVLAGTYRGFGETDHLQEKLSLLWQPDRPFADAFGLKNDDTVIEFQRGKKYRAVAANELFRPDLDPLLPLYSEEKLLAELQEIRRRAGKGEFSEINLIAAVQALIHTSPKLRYCMELICSELFLLTSPANHKPLRQELARLMEMFDLAPNPAAEEIVTADLEALGKHLTVVQSYRERRSVLLVPACTTRSNDYWHAGQASVLASGTATVFCNAVGKGSAGGSCFIGIDSVTPQADPAGVVRLLTPYHGWLRGILQPDGKGALSKDDQALVVVDLDPVHVVSGKPRPQLLPEPMSLVAYLPIVEVVNQVDNAEGLAKVLLSELNAGAGERVKSLFLANALPTHPHERTAFFKAYQELLDAKASGKLSPSDGSAALDAFAAFFGEPEAVRQRITAWLKDRHQQPAPKAGALRLEPAWLDFLIADLTCKGDLPTVKVPPWMEESFTDSANGSGTN